MIQGLLKKRIASLESQVAELRQALEEYGGHFPNCNKWKVAEGLEWESPNRECTCGLEQALGEG